MAVSWLTVEEARLSDATSPRAAAVATTLKLVSCSGIRHICHGDRETDGENTGEGEMDGLRWWSHDCGIELFGVLRRGIWGSPLLQICGFDHLSRLILFYFIYFSNVHTAILLLHKNLHPFLSTVQSIRSRYKWKAPHAAELSRSSQTAQKFV